MTKKIRAVKIKSLTLDNPTDAQLLAVIKCSYVIFEHNGVLMYDRFNSLSSEKRDGKKIYRFIGTWGAPTIVTEELKSNLEITDLT